MNKIKRKLSEKKADMYIQTLISILLIMIVLMIGLAVVPAITEKIRIDFAADEIARYIALAGDSDINNTSVEEIADTYGIAMSEISVETDVAEAAGETRIQLSDGFTVTIIHPIKITFGGFIYTMELDINSVSRGRSEVYWKALDEP